MKKEYFMPVMEEIDMKQEMMLCVSGDIVEEATDPALAPDMVYD
jgi:hypothetical protein